MSEPPCSLRWVIVKQLLSAQSFQPDWQAVEETFTRTEWLVWTTPHPSRSLFLIVAIGKTREGRLIRLLACLMERRGGICVCRGECKRLKKRKKKTRRVVIHQGLVIHWGAIIFKVTGLDYNNVPIATIIFNDYYYYCHKVESGASLIEIWCYATALLNGFA